MLAGMDRARRGTTARGERVQSGATFMKFGPRRGDHMHIGFIHHADFRWLADRPMVLAPPGDEYPVSGARDIDE